MITTQVCPHCGNPVDAQDRDCSVCGINLALAAGYAASALMVEMPLPSTTPIAPEVLVPRLGEILLEKGILSFDQLHTALEQHREMIATGQSKLFGQLLLELGLIDRSTLDQVVTEQILKLQQALQSANQKLEQRVRERTRDLQNALEKLAELNELKTNFISNISHELRTPLTHIKGYLTLLAEQALGPLTRDQADALSVVVRAEARLEQLIEDLIQFSLVARGQLSLHYSRVDLCELAQAAVKKCTAIADRLEINLRFKLPDHPLFVWVDSEKISWVLIQLLDNALKFTPQGGHVTIFIYQEDGLASVGVEDTGIGIPGDKLQDIFEPFYQIDGSSTRRVGGAGLGLALVKRIVEAHGAELKVTSAVGKGSRFEFSIPIKQDEH